MNFLNNKAGVALVTALMFTMVAFVISMTLLYMVTSGIKTSGAYKRYKTALDATYGGTELVAKEMMGKALAFANYSSSSNTFSNYMQTEMGTLTSPTVSDCYHERLMTPTKFWSTACAVTSNNPKLSPDLTFQLGAVSSGAFTVYSKIVDTSEWRIVSIVNTGVSVTNIIAGNSELTSGGSNNSGLEKGGTGSGGSNDDPKIPHYPYIYRVVVQGERQTSSAEKGNVSVLYAY